MELTLEFLVSKNLISDDKNALKRLLHRMWFALYPRSRRVKGSCAFEHVFLGERETFFCHFLSFKKVYYEFKHPVVL